MGHVWRSEGGAGVRHADNAGAASPRRDPAPDGDVSRRPPPGQDRPWRGGLQGCAGPDAGDAGGEGGANAVMGNGNHQDLYRVGGGARVSCRDGGAYFGGGFSGGPCGGSGDPRRNRGDTGRAGTGADGRAGGGDLALRPHMAQSPGNYPLSGPADAVLPLFRCRGFGVGFRGDDGGFARCGARGCGGAAWLLPQSHRGQSDAAGMADGGRCAGRTRGGAADRSGLSGVWRWAGGGCRRHAVAVGAVARGADCRILFQEFRDLPRAVRDIAGHWA